MTDKMVKLFETVFGEAKEVRVFFSPGRVNLIGEHTDYNGGHVFPCALTIGTYAAVRMRNDRRLRFYSENFADRGIIETSLDELVYRSENGWTNYCLGVLWALLQKGHELSRGFDFACYGNIPNGSGLSSSASLEVLTGYAVNRLYCFGCDNVELALIGQLAENKFVGVNCGIMDQFAIAMGRSNSAIFLDTATLEYEYVPVRLEGIKLVIGNTNKKRGLGDSKYNERRGECEQALAELQSVVNISSLGELDNESFEKYKSAIKDEVRVKRARHAVSENRRTIAAVAALNAGDTAEFGRLMNESHESLDKDYEVTGDELNALAAAARKQKGVLGARMTGAGFGGCTVSLVRDECVEAFIRNVGEEYQKKIGYAADFYVVDIGSGPVEMECGGIEVEVCEHHHHHHELLEKVSFEMPDEEELYALAELFKCFGDSTRMKILFVLFESEMCVCDIAEALNMTQSAVSHQLKVLKQAKLINNRREGKSIIYMLADEHVSSIIACGKEHIEEN